MRAMRITTHLALHPKEKKKYAVHTIANANGLEVTYSPFQSSIVSIRFTNHVGASLPIAYGDPESMAGYMGKFSTPGRMLGPISFPYRFEEATIGKTTYKLPEPSARVKFKTTEWTSSVECTEKMCVVVARSATRVPNENGAVTYTSKIILNQENRLFVEYRARSAMKMPTSMAHNIIWCVGDTQSVLSQRATINAERFSVDPLLARMDSIVGSKRDYREPRAIQSNCEGFYKVRGASAAHGAHNFNKSVQGLNPAIMISDPYTRRYMQCYTNFPFVRIKLYRDARKKMQGIQCLPCIPLDAAEIFARRNNRYFFRCCYAFGTLLSG